MSVAVGRASWSSSTSAIRRDGVEESGEVAALRPRGELLRGDDQLVQVLEPALGLGRALPAERLAKPGAVDDRRHPLRRAAAAPAAAAVRLLDQAHELPERPAAPGPRAPQPARASRRQERRPGGRRELLEAAERRPPDAAGRRAEGPPEGEVVRRVRHEPEVREGVLDLPALVEADAAHDVVGQARHAERVLQHARLGVRPVEHGDAVQRLALPAQLRHGPRDPERLLGLVPRPEEPRRLAARVLGPEALLLARLVVRDHGGGDLEDAPGRPVVLLEADDPAAREVPLEVEDVPEVRAAEPVDGLVGVPDDAEVPVLRRELAQEPVLGGVGVLVLVDEHVAPEVPVVVEHVRVPREELHRQAKEVVEVDGAEPPAAGPRTACRAAPPPPRAVRARAPRPPPGPRSWFLAREIRAIAAAGVSSRSSRPSSL